MGNVSVRNSRSSVTKTSIIDNVAAFSSRWASKLRFLKINFFLLQVVEFGWPDHHAPCMNLLICIVKTMDSWLREVGVKLSVCVYVRDN